MKQMLQSKKTRTLLPLFLALLLIFLAVPFAASAEGETDVTPYPEQLLLKLDALDATSASYNPGELAVANAEKQHYNTTAFQRGKSVKSDIIVVGSQPFGGFALDTKLPLNTNTSYTVELYFKYFYTSEKNELNFFFGLANNFSANFILENARAVLFQKDGMGTTTVTSWNPEANGKKTLTDNLWNSGKNEEGYTRLVLSIDGSSKKQVKVYSGTDLIASYSFENITASTLQLVAGLYNKDINNQPQANQNDYTAWKESGNPLGSLKDISVYSGVYTPAQLDELYSPSTPAVRFEKADGTLIEKRELVDGSLTVESFPEITSDKTVCWFNKETGELVQAGAIFEKDTVLVAREFGRNETVLVGAQDGAPANNKVNARFVGGVYDLSGDQIGFDIEVTYKGADGQDVVEKYRKEGSAVYTSLIAAGESYTANQKGVMYLFALTFEEIPVMATEITFTVKPFKSNGSIRIYGEVGNFTMVNGQFTDQPQA